jgi:hypothetical protein
MTEMKTKRTLPTLILFTLVVSFNFSQTSAITEQKNDITVISHRGLLTDTYYIVFGEIKNSGKSPIEKVKIEVKFFDGNNNFLSSVNATASLTVILPNRRSPFTCYLFGKNSTKVSSYSLGAVFYTFAEAKPEKLVITDYHYYNGTLWTHIFNNSTGPFQKATNNIQVVASLYLNETIIGVTAGYLNLPSPGLLWDLGTWDVSEGEPIVLDFGNLFPNEEVKNATQLIITAETPDFAAQEEIILSLVEEPSQNPNQFNYSWMIIPILLISCIIVYLRFKHGNRRRRAQFKKRNKS